MLSQSMRDRRMREIDQLAHLPTIIPGYDPEHALHELCHAATLGLRMADQVFLTRGVTLALGRLRPLAADWNEVWTCAAELRAAELLGWDVGSPKSILDGNVDVMHWSRAVRLIGERVGTDRAYRLACRAIDSAREAIEAFYREVPAWPGATGQCFDRLAATVEVGQGEA